MYVEYLELLHVVCDGNESFPVFIPVGHRSSKYVSDVPWLLIGIRLKIDQTFFWAYCCVIICNTIVLEVESNNDFCIIKGMNM